MKPHPARYPSIIPEWWTRFLTLSGNLVLDPFAGSNTTGSTVEKLGRRWISIERDPEYVRNSALRFGINPTDVVV